MALALRILSHSGLPVVVEESCIIIMILRLTWMTLSVLSYLVFHWMWPSKVTINFFKPQYRCAYSPHCALYLFYGMLVQISRLYDFMLSSVIISCIVMTCNPGQNYLRKFSPSCPLSYATKLFPKRRLCGKETPSPDLMLLPKNAQGSGFLLNTQQHCFQGKGEREELVQLRFLEKCCPSIQFSQQFCPRLCTFNQAVLSREEINNHWLLVTSDTGFKGLNPGVDNLLGVNPGGG